MLRGLGTLGLLGTVPLMLAALRALAERDYVAGALLVFGAAAVGHLGLELMALAQADPVLPHAGEEELP